MRIRERKIVNGRVKIVSRRAPGTQNGGAIALQRQFERAKQIREASETERRIIMSPVKKPSNRTELFSLYQRAEGIKKKLEAIHSDHTLKVTKVDSDYDPLLVDLTEQEKKSVMPGILSAKKRKVEEVRASTADTRKELLSQLRQIKDVIDFSVPHLSNARTMASLYKIGTEDRTRLEASVAGMRPAEIRALAIQGELLGADTEQGRLMLAVAAVANSNLDQKHRLLSSDEVAALAFKTECEQISLHGKGVNQFYEQSLALAKEIEGEGKPTGTEKMAHGLRFGPNSRLLPPELPKERSMSAIEKIESALASEDGSIQA